MQTILVVVHIFLAAGLIGLILIQHGKGADMGAAFGSGASGTVFGSKGSASFLTRLTAGLATLFFVTSMVMAYFAAQRNEGNPLLDALQQQAVEVESQQQSDLPPVPVGAEPAAPAATGDVPVVPEAEQSEAAVPDSSEVSAAPVETPQAATSETTPAEEPVQAESADTTSAGEEPPAVENKE